MNQKNLSTSNNNSKISIILVNSFMILLSILLCLCFLETISTFKRLNGSMIDSKLLITDIGDYFEAVINVIKGTVVNEVPDRFDEDINLLNEYIVNPNGLVTYKVFAVLIFLTALLMFILPLILLVLSINNIIKSKTGESYKKLLIWFLFLSLLMVLLINANDFGVGSGIITYIILSTIGVLSAVIIQFVYEHKQIILKKFILNLISFVSMFVLFFLLMVSFSEFYIQTQLAIWYKAFSLNFGSILSNLEVLLDSEVNHTNYYIRLIENLNFRKYSSFNLQYLLPIFQVGAISFCLSAFVLQLKTILLKKDSSKINTYLIIGFILFLLFTITATIFSNILDDHIKKQIMIYGEEVVINPFIYVVLAIFLGVNIYQIIFKKKVNTNI